MQAFNKTLFATPDKPNGDLPAFTNLVEQGFDLNQSLGTINETPVTLLALNGRSDFLKIAAQKGKPNVNHQTTNGWTALMFAARGPVGSKAGNTTEEPKFVETVKTLLDMGADKTLKNKSGDTALSFAKRSGFTQIVKLLE